jgi:uncharacterized protein (DUF433 family)
MTIVETVKAESGLFTLSEASRFARMPFNTLRYWLYGTTVQPALRDSQIKSDEGKFITFLEFIEALAIRSLRQERKVPLPKIREAIKVANEKYGIKYPFAQQAHKTVLIGKDMHILFGEDVIGLTGKERDQKSFKPFLEPYMENLRYNVHKVACEYVAYRFGDGPEKIITMNPRFSFGEPMVGRTGYSAETLWRAALAEGSIDKTCQYYEVERDAVVAACDYWQGLLAA